MYGNFFAGKRGCFWGAFFNADDMAEENINFDDDIKKAPFTWPSEGFVKKSNASFDGTQYIKEGKAYAARLPGYMEICRICKAVVFLIICSPIIFNDKSYIGITMNEFGEKAV